MVDVHEFKRTGWISIFAEYQIATKVVISNWFITVPIVDIHPA